MQIEEMIETLQGSALTDIFTNLDTVEKEQKDEVSWFALEISHPFDDGSAFLDLIQFQGSIVFKLRNLARATNDLSLVARTAHVNHMTPMPKMCWDPEDGEIYLEWQLLGTDPELSPVHLEKILASFLNIFFAERLYFLAAKLKAAELSDGILQQVFEPIKKRVEEEYVPALHAILGE